MTSLDLIATVEVAQRLGITRQQVNRLVDRGHLVRVARGLLDRRSVEGYAMTSGRARTRAWSEATAWGAVALLGGGRAAWLGGAQESRLRSRLRAMDSSSVVSQTRNRARVVVCSGHRSAAGRLSAELVVADASVLGLVESERAGVDGYLAADDVVDTMRRYGLVEDVAGTLTLRATSFDLDRVGHLASGSTVLAALDAATSWDARVRGVATRALDDALDRLK